MKDVDEKSWQEKYNEYTTRPKSKSLMLSASSIVNSDMVHFFFVLRHIKAHTVFLNFLRLPLPKCRFFTSTYTLALLLIPKFFVGLKNSAMYLEID